MTHYGLAGPSLVDLSVRDPVQLHCSFSHLDDELHQLGESGESRILNNRIVEDVKWYKDKDQEPFLQWIPGSNRSRVKKFQNFKFDSSFRNPQFMDGTRILAGKVRVGYR